MRSVITSIGTKFQDSRAEVFSCVFVIECSTLLTSPFIVLCTSATGHGSTSHAVKFLLYMVSTNLGVGMRPGSWEKSGFWYQFFGSFFINSIFHLLLVVFRVILFCRGENNLPIFVFFHIHIFK